MVCCCGNCCLKLLHTPRKFLGDNLVRRQHASTTLVWMWLIVNFLHVVVLFISTI